MKVAELRGAPVYEVVFYFPKGPSMPEKIEAPEVEQIKAFPQGAHSFCFRASVQVAVKFADGVTRAELVVIRSSPTHFIERIEDTARREASVRKLEEVKVHPDLEKSIRVRRPLV